MNHGLKFTKSTEKAVFIDYVLSCQPHLPQTYKPSFGDRIIPYVLIAIGAGIPLMIMRELCIYAGHCLGMK
jgi:hypothetical protein